MAPFWRHNGAITCYNRRDAGVRDRHVAPLRRHNGVEGPRPLQTATWRFLPPRGVGTWRHSQDVASMSLFGGVMWR